MGTFPSFQTDISQHWLVSAGLSVRPDAVLPEDFSLSDNIIEAWSQVLKVFNLTAEKLLAALSEQIGFPVCHIDRTDLDAAGMLSEQQCRELFVLPLRADESGDWVFAISDLTDPDSIRSSLRFATGKNIRFELMQPDLLDTHLINLFARSRSLANKSHKTIDLLAPPGSALGDGAHTVRLAMAMLRNAIDRKSSDIHVHPFVGGAAIRFRIDGVMQRISTLPKAMLDNLTRYFKANSGMDPSNSNIAQDGRLRLLYDTRELDARLSILPCQGGERLVIRLLDQQSVFSLKKSGFARSEELALRRMTSYSAGIVLLTGPTGSGKTSTLYALLSELNRVNVNIITIEDPVEYNLPGISQVQVNKKQGLTFASALRSILRQDPDIVLVGEIRDGETAGIAAQAALTGHLVLSTLHTNDALSTIPRLLNLGLEADNLADALIGVVSQRLLRKLCRHCAVPVSEPMQPVEQEFMRITGEKPSKRPTGCNQCNFTGFDGRLPVTESVEMTADMRSILLSGKKDLKSLESSLADDYNPMAISAMRWIIAGQTTPLEAHRVLGMRFWNELAVKHGFDIRQVQVGNLQEERDEGLAVLVLSASTELTTGLSGKLPYPVLTANDIEQARQLLEDNSNIMSIVFDARLGADNASTWLEELRRNFAWSGLPVIFLTDSTSGNISALLEKFGADQINIDNMDIIKLADEMIKLWR